MGAVHAYVAIWASGYVRAIVGVNKLDCTMTIFARAIS